MLFYEEDDALIPFDELQRQYEKPFHIAEQFRGIHSDQQGTCLTLYRRKADCSI